MIALLDLTLHLRVVGICLLLLVGLNLLMPKYFGWPAELRKLSLLTRQVFVVHAIFICFVLLLMAILLLFFTPLLLDRSPLATVLLAGLTLFWSLRLAAQFFIYSPQLWRGQPFRTTMHVFFACLWTYFAVVYGTAFVASMR